ncbi:hypothetical protein [Nocardioides alcanivorans]|uniref:hypothetical protein n=1 Tax=Nocardioides alcanivorans TaxID=2897352 RepID=UPI001F420F0F|nr:hypothetical protein [Nocardioides alcanivorans]
MNEHDEPPVATLPMGWATAGCTALALHLLWLVPAVRASAATTYGAAAAGSVVLVALAIALLRRESVPGPFLRRSWAAVLLGVAVAGTAWALRDGPSTAVSTLAAAGIASAPGAVLLSRPLTLAALRQHAQRQGIGLPNGQHLMAAGDLDSLVLDKHRSVTTGSMEITSVEPIDAEHRNNLLFFAGALSHSSTEPATAALARRTGKGRVTDFKELDGKGLTGAVDRHPVRVGRPDWLGLTTPEIRGVTMAVEVDHRTLGAITVDDVLRPHAREQCADLAAMAPLTLVTDAPAGDAAALAEDVGVARHIAGCGADCRLDVVKRTQGDGHRVGFIGTRSATNLQALEQCDLAVTDHRPGTPRLEHAVTLDEFDLTGIVRGLSLTRNARRRVRRADLVPVALSLTGGVAGASGLLSAYAAASVGLAVSVIAATWVFAVARRS